MIVLDAYCLIALLLDEPAAEGVTESLSGGPAAMTAINLAEALDVLERRSAVPEIELRRELTPLLERAIAVLPVLPHHAWRAAGLRARYYSRRERPLSLADCFLLASAADGDRIATADPALAEAARQEGIEVVALPDSTGAYP